MLNLIAIGVSPARPALQPLADRPRAERSREGSQRTSTYSARRFFLDLTSILTAIGASQTRPAIQPAAERSRASRSRDGSQPSRRGKFRAADIPVPATPVTLLDLPASRTWGPGAHDVRHFYDDKNATADGQRYKWCRPCM